MADQIDGVKNKASQEYWNREFADFKFHIAKPGDVIRRWIETHVEPASDTANTCIEIGCYPGRFSAVFGELGYKLYGIDLVENLDAVPRWLSEQGYTVGEFWRQDFTAFNAGRTFDVVCSFGFVEHFTNWEDILVQHAALVADNGLLVVEAPNFIGSFQYWLHVNYDKANYQRHYIPAMAIEAWEEVLEARGFEILYGGYFGKFHFWTEPEQRDFSQRLVLTALGILKPLLKRILPGDVKAYAPFCGVIARKPG